MVKHKFLWLFFVICGLNFCQNYSFNHQNSSQIPAALCKIIDGITRENPDTRTVLFGMSDVAFSTDVLKDSLKCLPNDFTVIVAELMKDNTEIRYGWKKLQMQNNRYMTSIDVNLEKSAIIVIFTDDLNMQQMVTLLLPGGVQKATFNYFSKFIFVTSKFNDFHLRKLTKLIQTCGIYNFAIIYEHNSSVFVRVDDSSRRRVKFTENALMIPKTEITEKLFPDHTKNTIFSVLLHLRYPFVVLHNKQISSLHLRFLLIFCEKQGILLDLYLTNPKDSYVDVAIKVEKMKFAMKRQYDLFLSDVITLKDNSASTSLMTYEEIGICVMIPLPKVISVMEFAFFKPFNFIVWLLLVLSLFLGTFLWKLLKHEGDSYWRFLSAILAVLVNQSVSITPKRLMLTILLQVFIFSAFYLRNLYEGIVTSVMTEGFVERRFSTFDELIESHENYQFYASAYFVERMVDSPHYDKIKNWLAFSMNSSFQELSQSRAVLITTCAQVDQFMSLKASPFYYVLPEKLFPQYLRFDVGYFSQYIEKLQELMDQSFESGLTHVWKMFHDEFLYNDVSDKSTKIENHEPQPLTLKDLHQVFVILPIGFAFTLLAFMYEYFYHKYQHVSWTWIKIVVMRKLRGRNARVAPFRPA